jgi:hypothetical protein
MLTVPETIKAIEATRPRSKWQQGVKQTALDMLEPFRDETMPERFADRRKMMLNGARDWESYIYGGCGLVYNRDIAERFFTASEMREYMRPGHDASMAWHGETLLDMYVRAIRQAEVLIARCAREGK